MQLSASAATKLTPVSTYIARAGNVILTTPLGLCLVEIHRLRACWWQVCIVQIFISRDLHRFTRRPAKLLSVCLGFEKWGFLEEYGRRGPRPFRRTLLCHDIDGWGAHPSKLPSALADTMLYISFEECGRKACRPMQAGVTGGSNPL